jgi:cytochrome c oxidase assembly protein subunit 15
MRKTPPVVGAVVLAAAVTLQAAIGIFTLVLAVPIELGLMHQAMAMLVLTVATLHAAAVAERTPRRALAPPVRA